MIPHTFIPLCCLETDFGISAKADSRSLGSGGLFLFNDMVNHMPQNDQQRGYDAGCNAYFQHPGIHIAFFDKRICRVHRTRRGIDEFLCRYRIVRLSEKDRTAHGARSGNCEKQIEKYLLAREFCLIHNNAPFIRNSDQTVFPVLSGFVFLLPRCQNTIA